MPKSVSFQVNSAGCLCLVLLLLCLVRTVHITRLFQQVTLLTWVQKSERGGAEGKSQSQFETATHPLAHARFFRCIILPYQQQGCICSQHFRRCKRSLILEWKVPTDSILSVVLWAVFQQSELNELASDCSNFCCVPNLMIFRDSGYVF